MKPKTLVLMGVAIACGLGASYMTSRLLAERSSDDEPKITVLVARRTLNIGDTIKVPDDLFQEKKFTRGEEPQGAITDAEQVKNRVLKRPLRPGDHVTQDDLISGTEGDGMSIVLPGGYRAIGVRVNVESTAFGFACLPLSRVDLVSTVRRADDKATYSQVLLENVLVLAADDKMRRGDDGKPMPSQVVTLALKPEDALKVALAAELGSLRLLLRKVNDMSRADKTKVTYETLKTGEFDQPDDFEATSGPHHKPAAPSSDPKAATDPKTVVDAKPPTDPKVEPKPADPPVADVKQPKWFVMTVVEGGRTRQIRYLQNDDGEFIETEGGDSHPPRPDAVTDPKNNK
jgi:pilus assembly protein CpaB